MKLKIWDIRVLILYSTFYKPDFTMHKQWEFKEARGSLVTACTRLHRPDIVFVLKVVKSRDIFTFTAFYLMIPHSVSLVISLS